MEAIVQGILLALTPEAVGAVILGLAAGQVLGAIPGLTATMAVALLVPYTFYLAPWIGIPMLVGMFKGSLFGGSVSAVLLKAPGTPAAAATVLDGYPLAQQGKARKAMKMALYASIFGDSFSDLCLIFFAGLLAMVALRFGPAEYTLIVAFSLLTLGSITGPEPWKGFVSVLIGMVIGIIGLDPVTATPRLTFGSLELEDGIGLIPMLVGFLAVSEVFLQMEQSVLELARRSLSFSPNKEDQGVSWPEFRGCLPVLVRSSVIGTLVGILPGISSTVAAFLAYNEAKRTSRTPERFGQGALEGVAAPEAANNAVSGANLIPLLAFGIPGDIMAALILGALLIQGISPGPMVFQKNPVEIYAILAAMLLANAFNLGLGHILIAAASHVVAVPKRILYPAVLIIAAAGAYAVRGSVFDVQLVFLFGLLGYAMMKLRFPTVPLLIGYILMPILETNLRLTLVILGTEREPALYLLLRPAFTSLAVIMAVVVILMVRQRALLVRGTPSSADEE